MSNTLYIKVKGTYKKWGALHLALHSWSALSNGIWLVRHTKEGSGLENLDELIDEDIDIPILKDRIKVKQKVQEAFRLWHKKPMSEREMSIIIAKMLVPAQKREKKKKRISLRK